MFLLATRDRPHEVDGMLDAMALAHAGAALPRVHVLLDGYLLDEDRGYDRIDWPPGWRITELSEHVELTRAINFGMALNPGERSYGFFGDHFRPLTPFADALAEAAGDWFMAWPNDGRSSERQPAGCPTFGAKLIEALGGWIMLPTTVHCCTDRVWWHIWREVGNVKHVEQARFDRTWPIGRGAGARYYQGRDYTRGDFQAWKDWEANQAPQACARIRAGMKADGFRFDADGRLSPGQGQLPFQEGW